MKETERKVKETELKIKETMRKIKEKERERKFDRGGAEGGGAIFNIPLNFNMSLNLIQFSSWDRILNFH